MPKKLIEADYIGKKYNRYTILKFDRNRKPRKLYVVCKCDCGNIKTVEFYAVRVGILKSCGCYKKESDKAPNEKNKTHGLSTTRLYKIYLKMIQRCYNKSTKNYKIYGGRGISVCDEWHNDFMSFYNWAVLNGYADNLTIDRINVNGNYEPNNCRWATVKQQANNTRVNKIVKYAGKSQTISEWADEIGMNYQTLYDRIIHYDWTIEKALTKPVRTKSK